MHKEDTYCVINYRHVREGLTSLNNSSGDFEDESKAVRDQMQIRFISVKPDRGAEGKVVCTTPQRKHCRHCVNLRSRRVVIARLHQPLLAFVSFTRYICTLCKCSLYFGLLTNAEILENCSHSTETKLEFVPTAITLSRKLLEGN